MRVTVFPTVESFGTGPDLQGFRPVAIDVLRATSTICTALAAGAKSVRPFLEPAAARAAAEEMPGPPAPPPVLGGERGGTRIAGFHLGNSPAEYTPAAVGGREVLFTTSNGTRAILAGAGLGKVYIGSFLNLSAIAQALAGHDVALICAGTLGSWSLEDLALAGGLCQWWGPGARLNETAIIARALYRDFQDRLPDLLWASDHGRRLARLGLGADLERCAWLDRLQIVPVYKEGRITPLRIP